MILTDHWEDPKKQRRWEERPLQVAKATLRLDTSLAPAPRVWEGRAHLDSGSMSMSSAVRSGQGCRVCFCSRYVPRWTIVLSKQQALNKWWMNKQAVT